MHCGRLMGKAYRGCRAGMVMAHSIAVTASMLGWRRVAVLRSVATVLLGFSWVRTLQRQFGRRGRIESAYVFRAGLRKEVRNQADGEGYRREGIEAGIWAEPQTLY